jgi:hypothetical protein
MRVVRERGDLRLIPPGTLKLDLKAGGKAGGGQTGVRPGSDHRLTPVSKRRADPVAAGSWWTARARTGEVTGGFTRAEIMRPSKEDPRGEGGVFTGVAGLLRELSAGGSIG